MKKIEVCETIKHYHMIEVDDEVDIEGIVSQAYYNSARYDTGCEAIEELLKKVKDTYGLNYEIKKDYCGTEIDGLNVVGEVD